MMSHTHTHTPVVDFTRTCFDEEKEEMSYQFPNIFSESGIPWGTSNQPTNLLFEVLYVIVKASWLKLGGGRLVDIMSTKRKSLTSYIYCMSNR